MTHRVAPPSGIDAKKCYNVCCWERRKISSQSVDTRHSGRQEMTWREASIAALVGVGPLNINEITSRIRELNLRDLTGNTPEATVGAQLYGAIQNGDQRVRLVSPGVFEHTGVDRGDVTERTLGRLEFINPRDVWPDEARHFTPWLLDNADYLQEVLGIDIEMEQSEHPVGPFSLDLFGRDVTNNCRLIVENQLEQTDHRHLGQLLTYAAGTRAGTIVWIAPTFRDEHRDALDFLNETSSDDVRYFGVKLRVAITGDSDPAPDFELVAQPSGWKTKVRSQRSGTSNNGELSDLRTAQLEFWSKYLEQLHEQHPNVTNVRAAQPQNWMTLNFSRRIGINAAFASTGDLRCEVYIDVGDGDANLRLYNALLGHKDTIESTIGGPLLWDELETRRACRISYATPGSPSDEDTDRLISWLTEHHLKFRDAFLPIIRDLPSTLWA